MLSNAETKEQTIELIGNKSTPNAEEITLSINLPVAITEEKHSLVYLAKCSQKVIVELENLYKKDRYELDDIIKKHPIFFKMLKYFHQTSKWSNGLFSYQLLKFGDLTLSSFSEAMFSKPFNLGNKTYIITVPLSALDFMLFWLVFSPSEKAVIEILHYVHSSSLKEHLLEFYKQTKKFILYPIIEAAHLTIYTIPNLTVGMPRILAAESLLSSYSRRYKLPLYIVLNIVGFNFAAKYYPWNVYRKNFVTLYDQIKNGNFLKGFHPAIKLQIAMQYLVSVITNAFPTNFVVAELGAEAMGWWFNKWLVLATTLIQVSVITLPSIIDHFNKDNETVNDLVQKKIIDDIHINVDELKQSTDFKEEKSDLSMVYKALASTYGDEVQKFLRNQEKNWISDQMNINDTELKKIMPKMREIYREYKLQEQPWFFALRKNFAAIPPLILYHLVSAYIGYKGSSFIPSIPRGLSGFILASVSNVIFSGTQYKTEQIMQLNREIIKDLTVQQAIQPMEEKKAERGEKALRHFITTANFGSALISMTILMGTLAYLIINLPPDIKSPVIILMFTLAVMNALYQMVYNLGVVNNTAQNIKETVLIDKFSLENLRIFTIFKKPSSSHNQNEIFQEQKNNLTDQDNSSGEPDHFKPRSKGT